MPPTLTKLDAIDRKILYELDRNSRQSISTLAHKVRLGRDRITYRLDRLADRGVLQKCAALIDPYRLGYSFYKTYLRLDASASRRLALERDLLTHPRTYWLAECDGAWDMIWCILAADPIEFRGFQTEMLSKYGAAVVDFSISTNVEVNVFYKNYLLGRGSGGRRLGGTMAAEPLSELDRGLLALVANDARSELNSLAEQLDSTPATVRNHLQNLEERGIIAGYRVDLDLASIGMTFFKVQVFTKSFRLSEEEQLCRFCDNHPNITHHIRQVGRAMIELEVDALDYPHFNDIVRTVRETHGSFIRNTEAILIRREVYRWPFGSQKMRVTPDGATRFA